MAYTRQKTTISTSSNDCENPAGCDHKPPAVPGHMEDPETCLSVLVDPSVSLWRSFAAFPGTFDSPTPRLD